MAELRISTHVPLGPLSVEVLGPRGERVGDILTLSSLRQSATVPSVSPGDYTIVATRPSGEKLISVARVGSDGGDGTIEMAGRSPQGFLTDAANLGLTYTPRSSVEDDFRITSLASPRAANTAARSMSVLLSQGFRLDGSRLSFADHDTGPSSVTKSADYRLVCWWFRDGHWRPAEAPVSQLSDDYLQIPVNQPAPVAVGLLGSDGFGPIVIVPPFLDGIDVTFLSAGVAMDNNADRASNPSAVRVPVALSVPRGLGIADLLVGLSAPVLPNATELLEEGRGVTPESALDYLSRKFNDPAAAVLGGLFLARFAPSSLPLAWLRNLNDLLPEVADTWLLLAWARSSQGDGDYSWDRSITEQLRRAATARCTYFSRSRFELSKLSLRYGPFPRARQDEVVAPRRARTGDYLDFAAEAGGLEAFWGYSPTRPGTDASDGSAPPPGRTVIMEQGKFISAD